MIVGGLYLVATAQGAPRRAIEPIAGERKRRLSAEADRTRHVFADRLARAITLAGPIPIAQFMAAANAHYYATRDPLGAGGDFTTAPEISQMFGELIGLWCADLWDRAGRPDMRLGRARPRPRHARRRCAARDGQGAG